VLDGLDAEWVPKAVVYGLGQLAIGVVVARALNRRRPSSGLAEDRFEVWIAQYALIVSVLLILALFWRVWTHAAAAFGSREAWLVENLRVTAIESRWGERWQLQLYAALGLAGAALVTRVSQHAWIAFTAGALGLALVMPLLGHAAGSAPRHGLHAAHNLAAALWLGTLVVITTLALWSRMRAPSWRGLAVLVLRFSPLALGGATVVMISGLAAAWTYLGSIDALWTSDYGKTVSLKLLLVGLVLVCGWTNWRRARARLEPRLPWMMAESIVAMLVLLVTGILTETEHP
jgi:putative copper export protein